MFCALLSFEIIERDVCQMFTQNDINIHNGIKTHRSLAFVSLLLWNLSCKNAEKGNSEWSRYKYKICFIGLIFQALLMVLMIETPYTNKPWNIKGFISPEV